MKPTCRIFIPVRNNDYADLFGLPQNQIEAVSSDCVERIGSSLNDYFGTNITAYQRLKT